MFYTKYYYCWHIKDYMLGSTCGTQKKWEMHSNLHMENLKAKDHVRDLNITVLHICALFDFFFISIKLWCLVVWDFKELNRCFDSDIICRIFQFFTYYSGWDSVIGTVTCYWLDGGLVGGEIFWTYPNWPQDPPSLLCNGYCVSTLWVKWVGHGFDQ